MKYMILVYGSQRDYDDLTGAGEQVWSGADFDRATEIAARLSHCPGPAAVRERAKADVRYLNTRATRLSGPAAGAR